MKPKFYIVLLFSAIILLFSAQSFIHKDENVSEKHLEIVLRDIGHRLLLHAKDTTSRVLPIKKINENTFQIEFQTQFTFVPDTLVNLVHQRLKSTNLPTEYIVNVLSCWEKEVIFGYEVSAKTDNILPCLGRSQPFGCYVVQLEFIEPPTISFYHYFLLLIPLIFIGFFMRKQIFSNKKTIKALENQDFIMIGEIYFYAEKSMLKFKSEVIELSDRETKLLKIFAQNQNLIIERERLLKEVWEDDGLNVIGRSLDVFVSKLRKKLQNNVSVRIVNIHGKGYKLEVD